MTAEKTFQQIKFWKFQISKTIITNFFKKQNFLIAGK